MNKKKFKLSLQIKFTIALVISLLLAAMTFYAVFEMGNFLVWRYYLGESNKQERAEEYVADFQKYVTENKLSVSDTEEIAKWDPGSYADMIIYKDQSLIYAPDWFADISGEGETSTSSGTESGQNRGESETETESPSETEGDNESGTGTDASTEAVTDKSFYEGWFSGDRGFEQYLTEDARRQYAAALDEALKGNNSLRPIYFVDGTLLVTFVDFTEEAMGDIVIAVSAISALLVVAVIMILYFFSVTRRIKRLAAKVRQIERGDSELRIKEGGNDDISRLADDVNSMRDAIVENMTREKRAWEANAGLITAMSHDIRTPLTVMLGYLDLMEMQNDDESCGEYISACRENAMRLKNLSDDMFSYFLVFGKGENALELVSVRADEWIGHVLGEQEILLLEMGFSIERTTEIPRVSISIDGQYFRRVMDNLFSNVIKYADPAYPVRISASMRDGNITLCFENRTIQDRDRSESNGIGLKTCIKIMEEMGGSLKHREEDCSFTVEMSLPAREE